MEHSQLIVRMSKTARLFFKSDRYNVNMEGASNFEMNHAQPTKTYAVSPGTHFIEIWSKNSSETKEITLKEGETKTLTINPVAGGHRSGKASLGRMQTVLLLFGISIASVVGMFLYFENVPIASIFLIFLAPFILLFAKNRKEDELGDFQITIQHKAILK